MSDRKPHDSNDNAVDTLRLSDRAQHEILSKMRHQAAQAGRVDRRNTERVDFVQTEGISVTIHHPGGSTVKYLVRPRNLSRHGMGFLHGQFIYTGTPCTVHLTTVEHEPMLVEGAVVRCVHVHGKVHEIGVQFDSVVSVCDYIMECSVEDDDDDPAADRPQFVGKGIYVEARPVDRELLRFVLADYGAELAFASNDAEAFEMLGKSMYDIVFVGEEHEGVIEQLRQTNYPGPIVFVTAQEDGDTADRAKADGATEVLIKPYAPPDLAQILQTHLRLNPEQLGLEALVSANWANVKMRPLVLNYLGTLEEQVSKLERFAAGDDLKAIHKVIHAIKGDAGGYGYPQISELARTLFELTDDGAKAEQWQTAFNELKNLCLRACLVRRENTG